MADPIELRIVWQGREVDITYIPSWLNGIAQHLELLSTCPLSVTETGYKSHFITTSEVMTDNELERFVREWLDAAALDKDWRASEERSRQGDLFDP